MKLIRQLWFVVFILLISKSVFAFDPTTDCKKILSMWNVDGPAQTVLNNYTDTNKYSKLLADGTYALCFEPSKAYQDNISKTISIVSKVDSNGAVLPLLIYGLNISTTSDQTLLTLSGSNITLLNSTFTGSGSGTAIQVNAPSEGVTIGPAVTIDNFEKGIFIKSGASAKVTQNSIKVKNNFITDALNFETPIVSAFSENLIGKHLSEADPNYADKFVGQLAGKTADSCIGNVEMLSKVEEGKNALYNFNYLAACSLKWIKDDADKVTLKNKDETTTDIGANSCIFECKDLNTAVNYLVTFVHTDGNGITSDYLPSTPLVSDMADVINVPGLPIYTPTTSGVTPEPTEPVAPPQEPANFDPSNPKGQTNDTNNSDGDGGDVSQGSGCGANISASAPNAGGLIVQIMLLFGSLPIIINRRKR